MGICGNNIDKIVPRGGYHMGDKMTGKKPKTKDKKNDKLSIANDQLGENAGVGKMTKTQNKK